MCFSLEYFKLWAGPVFTELCIYRSVYRYIPYLKHTILVCFFSELWDFHFCFIFYFDPVIPCGGKCGSLVCLGIREVMPALQGWGIESQNHFGWKRSPSPGGPHWWPVPAGCGPLLHSSLGQAISQFLSHEECSYPNHGLPAFPAECLGKHSKTWHLENRNEAGFQTPTLR